MDREFVRAYIWQDVIRLGFSPSGTPDQKKWLIQYGNSLTNFWEVPHSHANFSQTGNCLSATIDTSRPLGMTYEYAIEGIKKFTVRLMYTPPLESRELMWIHDMDGQYFHFPNQSFLTHYKPANIPPQNMKNLAINKMGLDDIGAVVDSLILHPTPHQHIESPLENHEIRIGGGLLNPFGILHLPVDTFRTIWLPSSSLGACF